MASMTDTPRWLLAPMVMAGALLLGPQSAQAQAPERSGKEVVEAVCAACHGSGAKGAPRIGDQNAWSKRASQGLTSLTQNALKGIREMPAHGGSSKLTDLEIGRAVAYMVNQSGGKWVEPASAKDMAAERSGAEIVKMQCGKCHEKGVGGAPKIGDRAAWAPRLKDGLDSAVRSAIRGHGGMPPRGDKADLTDAEIKNAINYMFNPAVAAPAKKAAPSAAAKSDADRTHKLVAGTDIYLGVLPAETMRSQHAAPDSKARAAIPEGKGYYLVSVVLRDNATRAEIRNAQVEARVANLMTGETRQLDAVTVNNTLSYGAYFQMAGKDPYTVSLKILKPGAAAPVETKFEVRN
jgi:cytochrome c5